MLGYFRRRILNLKSERGLSSAIVVILLAAAGILIATIAIKFLKGAQTRVIGKANKTLEGALAEIE